MTFECREYGDAAVLVEVRGDDYEERWAAAQALGRALREAGFDVLATYQHVFVAFDPRFVTSADVTARVADLAGMPVSRPAGTTLEIPVVYDGPDFEAVAEELSLEPGEVVALHRSQPWTVRFIASPLAAPFCDGPRFPAPVRRLAAPRVRVPAGSVAISGQQTTIYNGPSPGGWRLIGHTAPLFTREAEYRHTAPETGCALSELVIERAGNAVVQDLGRPGHLHVGIPPNGAADQHAARTVNVIVGNPDDAPMLEVTGSELAFVPRSPVLLAVSDPVFIDGQRQPARQPLPVFAGSHVLVPAARGLRTYVALNGELAAERVLGSVAPDRLMGFGRHLRARDVLGFESAFDGSGELLFRFAQSEPDRVFEVTPGPELSWLADGEASLSARYEVSPQSDHIGLRLLGPPIERRVDEEILSRGVPAGAVQAPPTGGLIVLLRGRMATAGYPVIAVVTTVSLDALGQVGPGDTLTFALRDTAAATERLRRRERELDDLAQRVRSAFVASGLSALIDPRHRSANRG